MKARILVIDDETEIRRSVKMILEYDGYDVQEASTGPEGLALIEREPPDLVFMDIRMPGLDGLEALQKIRQINETLPVVIISGHGTVSTAVEATKLGAFDFIEKPLASERLLVTIRNALDQTRLKDENRTLKRAVEARYQMVGESAPLRNIWDSIKRAAPTNATVLLLGESGTGKELFARALHALSGRAAGPFVPINCAAIPEPLLESELFGYEKGAFTGASARKPGRFELAHRGTLFLDEIGELSLTLQAKLLRVLEHQTFERLGGTVPVDIDVRLVAATNRDLRAAVTTRQFREDLYFRLAVLPLTIPPLRERISDVPLLARHFLAAAAADQKKPTPTLSPAAGEALQAYHWPGNVRELENCVERAVILADGIIQPSHLNLTPPAAAEANGNANGSSSDASSESEAVTTFAGIELDGTMDQALRRVLREVERRKIALALAETGGDTVRAARLLRIPSRLLARRMDAYGMREK